MRLRTKTFTVNARSSRKGVSGRYAVIPPFELPAWLIFMLLLCQNQCNTNQNIFKSSVHIFLFKIILYVFATFIKNANFGFNEEFCTFLVVFPKSRISVLMKDFVRFSYFCRKNFFRFYYKAVRKFEQPF